MSASAGYWQIQVDNESSELLVFKTPFGRFKFDRLLFGVFLQAKPLVKGFPGSLKILSVWLTSKTT